MGLPYSKQINEAFDQVTPLVAEGFKVLETTKDISLILATVQVLNTLFLFFILGALIALLITVSPDLEHERRTLVTPFLRWFTGWITDQSSRRYLKVVVGLVVVGIGVGGVAGLYIMRQSEVEAVARAEAEENGVDEEGKEEEDVGKKGR